MELQKDTLGLLTLANQADLARLDATLAEWQIPTYHLDGASIRDTDSFWAQAAVDLPLPAGRSAPTSWSAFSDNLWESFQRSEASEIALVWSGVSTLLDGGLADLLASVDALMTLSRQLYSPASPRTAPKTLYLFLVGLGPNFPRIFT
jgi:hypothetical protein